jgi:hypothetical protein
MTARFRILVLGVLASLALLAAGCGGAASTSGSSGAGAKLVRSDALAFLAVDTDFGSSQWKQVDSLAKRFPGRDAGLAKLQHSLTKGGVDWNKDVKPALGSEVDLAFVPGMTTKGFAVVGLTKPHDAGKFKTLVKKLNEGDSSGPPTVYRALSGGWYALGDSQAHIDQVLKSGGTALSAESTYKDALAKLPSRALAKMYVNGPQLAKVVQRYEHARGSSSAALSQSGLDKLDFFSASLSAESDGLRTHGAVRSSGDSLMRGSVY